MPCEYNRVTLQLVSPNCKETVTHISIVLVTNILVSKKVTTSNVKKGPICPFFTVQCVI